MYKGNDTVLDKTGDDEPIFVMAARDRLALEAVRYWIDCAVREGVNAAKLQDAEGLLERMADWQVANPDKVRTPD